MHAHEVCIVTGANRGLGLATAEGLARDGATVVLACRDAGRGAAAEAHVRAEAGHDRVCAMICDLADPESVEAFVVAFRERFDRLDVLVNNAGFTSMERRRSELGLELGWHVGYLGHFQLTDAASGHARLQRAGPGPVPRWLYQSHGSLDLADLGWRERDWDWSQAGCDSQLAKVLYTVELAERLAETGVTVNAVHPGAVRTQAQDVMPWHVRLLIDTVMRVAFVSPRRGARTVLRLAEDPDLADVTGKWFRRYHPGEPHALAADPSAREALWARSEQLLGWA